MLDLDTEALERSHKARRAFDALGIVNNALLIKYDGLSFDFITDISGEIATYIREGSSLWTFGAENADAYSLLLESGRYRDLEDGFHYCSINVDGEHVGFDRYCPDEVEYAFLVLDACNG